MIRLPTSLLSAALLTAVAAVALTPAMAATAANVTNQAEAHHQGGMRLTSGQLVDGRIAFLKAELKITSAQEPQWQQFTAAMRQNAQSQDQAISAARQHKGAEMNAVERMEARGRFAQLRADNQARLLAAFKPLYASLSPDQQKMANTLMASHGGWRHGWHHRA